MRISTFKIEGRTIITKDLQKLIGYVGQDKFVVEFEDSEWNGLHKTMKLIRPDGAIVHISEDMNGEFPLVKECYVKGTAKLGFFGTINENDTEEMAIATTDYTNIYFHPRAYVEGEAGIPINLPTPTAWDIIIGQMNEVKDDIVDMKTELDAEVEDIETKLENGDFDGRGIVNIEKISTVGLVDTYQINYTDGTSSTYTVTNGAGGEYHYDYNDLSNQPQINGHTLIGNKTSSDLGIDGEPNVIEKIKVNDAEQTIQNKAVNISVPTKTSQLTNDSGFIDKTANNLTYYTLKTNTGSLIDLEINGTTYVVTLSLKDQDGNVISTDTIDLPLESVVVSGRYDNSTKKVILTLENGSEVDFSVADLVAGLQSEITSQNKLASDLVDDSNSGNKFVTSSEKTTWGAKYDKPSGGIPSTDMTNAVQTSLSKADTAVQPTDYASPSVGGVIKYDNAYNGLNVGSSGFLFPSNINYNTYLTKENNYFIGKGTLENVITGKGLVSNTNYATSSTGGVIKADSVFGVGISNSGNIFAQEINYSNYDSFSRFGLVSKGTLENVITGKNLETANNKVISISGGSTDTQYPSAKCVYDTTHEMAENNLNEANKVATGVGQTTDSLDWRTKVNSFGADEFEQDASPSPSDPQAIKVLSGSVNIKVLGKNILPFTVSNLTLNRYISSSDGSYQASNSNNFYGSSEYIDFSYGGQTITLSDGLELAFYKSDNTFIRYVGRNQNRTTTVPSNCAYIRIDCYKDNINEMQIEFNSTQTTYESYINQTYPLTLPNGMYLGKMPNTTYENKIIKKDDGKFYWHKEIGKAVFDGSEIWQDRPNYAYADRFVLDNAFSQKTNEKNGVSNYFVVDTAISDTYPYITPNNNQVLINYSAKGTTTLEQFKTWLNSHNVVLYYVMNTTEDIEITDTTLLSQLNNLWNNLKTYKNITNITITGGDIDGKLDFDYYVDDRVTLYNYVDSQITDAIGGSY